LPTKLTFVSEDVADPTGCTAGAEITGARMFASINPYTWRTNPIIKTNTHKTPTAINDPVLKIMKKDKRRTTAIATGRAVDVEVEAAVVVVVVLVVGNQ
jgi:hypothetical protein